MGPSKLNIPLQSLALTKIIKTPQTANGQSFAEGRARQKENDLQVMTLPKPDYDRLHPFVSRYFNHRGARKTISKHGGICGYADLLSVLSRFLWMQSLRKHKKLVERYEDDNALFV
jgi:hypothetical protein